MPVLPLTLPVEIKGDSQPSAADVLRYSAVAMFAKRAEAAQPDFVVSDSNAAPIAELCRRLGGLPLAIELIAARVKLFQPDELLVYLRGPWLLSIDDVHNMRAALAWSIEHDVQASLLLSAILLDWFRERELLAEGIRLIDEVLTLPVASDHAIPRAKVLLMAAFLLSSVNKIPEAQAYAEEGLVLSQNLGYGKGEADAFVRLGRIAHVGWVKRASMPSGHRVGSCHLS